MKTKMMALLAAVSACGGSGTAEFTTWGEEYIEQELPQAMGEEGGFVDGWTLKYSKFLVVISEITIADSKGNSAASMQGAKVMDMTKPGPVELAKFENLPAQRWDEVSYAIAPKADATAGTASQADTEMMKSGGYGVYLEGTATKGTATKSIAWGFQLNTIYEHCQQEATGAGLVVPAGGTDTVQLTIHGDHPWFDDLQSPEAKMRFDPVAAADVSPADGKVTLEELQAVDLSTLPLGQYGTGSVSGVKNLREFIASLSRTVGHYRGEGECNPRAR